MDDSQEPSYYEIALTNRQVLVFFVVLLVCVVGAFFSGIWLGQQRSEVLPTIVEAPLEEAQEEGPETLAELNFFTDEESSPAAASSGRKAAAPASRDPEPRRKPAPRPEVVAPAGSPGTTLLEDVNGTEPAADPPKSAPVLSPAAESPAAEPVRSPAPSRNEPAISGGYVIQVFSSPDGTQARKVLDRLTSGGFEAFISPVDVDGRMMHRVRVGPFTDKGEAQTVATRVEKAYRLDTWVTAND